MRRKIRITLGEALYRKTKALAQREGRSVNEVIAEALGHLLEGETVRTSAVASTKGVFNVSPRTLRAVLEEGPLCDASPARLRSVP